MHPKELSIAAKVAFLGREPTTVSESGDTPRMSRFSSLATRPSVAIPLRHPLHLQLEGKHGGLPPDTQNRFQAIANDLTALAEVSDDGPMGDAGRRAPTGLMTAEAAIQALCNEDRIRSGRETPFQSETDPKRRSAAPCKRKDFGLPTSSQPSGEARSSKPDEN